MSDEAPVVVVGSRVFAQDDEDGAAEVPTVSALMGENALERANPSWVEDSASASCMVCSASFTTFRRRRHHCRLCGLLICGRCRLRLPIDRWLASAKPHCLSLPPDAVLVEQPVCTLCSTHAPVEIEGRLAAKRYEIEARSAIVAAEREQQQRARQDAEQAALEAARAELAELAARAERPAGQPFPLETIESLVATLSIYPEDAIIQQHGLATLGKAGLRSLARPTQAAVRKAAAAAVEKFGASDLAFSHACIVLRCLLSRSRTLFKAKLVGQIIRALHKSCSDGFRGEHAQTGLFNGLRLITQTMLISGCALVANFEDLRMLETMLAATVFAALSMEPSTDDRHLRIECLVAILVFVVDDAAAGVGRKQGRRFLRQSRACFVAAGIIPAILSTLRSHPQACIQDAGIACLGNLAKEASCEAPTLIAAFGGKDVLLAAQRADWTSALAAPLAGSHCAMCGKNGGHARIAELSTDVLARLDIASLEQASMATRVTEL